jgi:hypothetical protein
LREFVDFRKKKRGKEVERGGKRKNRGGKSHRIGDNRQMRKFNNFGSKSLKKFHKTSKSRGKKQKKETFGMKIIRGISKKNERKKLLTNLEQNERKNIELYEDGSEIKEFVGSNLFSSRSKLFQTATQLSPKSPNFDHTKFIRTTEGERLTHLQNRLNQPKYSHRKTNSNFRTKSKKKKSRSRNRKSSNSTSTLFRKTFGSKSFKQLKSLKNSVRASSRRPSTLKQKHQKRSKRQSKVEAEFEDFRILAKEKKPSASSRKHKRSKSDIQMLMNVSNQASSSRPSHKNSKLKNSASLFFNHFFEEKHQKDVRDILKLHRRSFATGLTSKKSRKDLRELRGSSAKKKSIDWLGKREKKRVVAGLTSSQNLKKGKNAKRQKSSKKNTGKIGTKIQLFKKKRTKEKNLNQIKKSFSEWNQTLNLMQKSSMIHRQGSINRANASQRRARVNLKGDFGFFKNMKPKNQKFESKKIGGYGMSQMTRKKKQSLASSRNFVYKGMKEGQEVDLKKKRRAHHVRTKSSVNF